MNELVLIECRIFTRPSQKKQTNTIPDVEYEEEASKLVVAFWGRIGEFLMRSRIGNELSDEEKAVWIQSGLAVSPLMGTCLQYSLDFCLAWALMGMDIPGPVSCPQRPEAETRACGCPASAEHPGLLPGHVQLLNKEPFHP